MKVVGCDTLLLRRADGVHVEDGEQVSTPHDEKFENDPYYSMAQFTAIDTSDTYTTPISILAYRVRSSRVYGKDDGVASQRRVARRRAVGGIVVDPFPRRRLARIFPAHAKKIGTSVDGEDRVFVTVSRLLITGFSKPAGR